MSALAGVTSNVANLDVKVDLNAKGEAVLTVMNGNLKVDNKDFDVKLSDDKKTAIVSATTGNKYYVGSKEITVGGEAAKVGAPVISGVKVVGNKATVILSGETDGATGYDYVISKANDTTTARVDVTKNQVKTTGDFNYVQQGTYYAYCQDLPGVSFLFPRLSPKAERIPFFPDLPDCFFR